VAIFLVFAADLCLNFFVAYYDTHGDLVTDLHSIAGGSPKYCPWTDSTYTAMLVVDQILHSTAFDGWTMQIFAIGCGTNENLCTALQLWDGSRT
jgi:hypothetical protein